jgi:hypothetical protein
MGLMGLMRGTDAVMASHARMQAPTHGHNEKEVALGTESRWLDAIRVANPCTMHASSRITTQLAT